MTRDVKFDGFLPCMYAVGKQVGDVWHAGETRGFVYRGCTNPAKGGLGRSGCARCADNVPLVQEGYWPFSDAVDRPSCPYFRNRVRNTL